MVSHVGSAIAIMTDKRPGLVGSAARAAAVAAEIRGRGSGGSIWSGGNTNVVILSDI